MTIKALIHCEFPHPDLAEEKMSIQAFVDLGIEGEAQLDDFFAGLTAVNAMHDPEARTATILRFPELAPSIRRLYKALGGNDPGRISDLRVMQLVLG